MVVIPWYDGGLPQLKVFRFKGSGPFPCLHRFERIHYVSTIDESAENTDFKVRAYVLEDRSGLHLMELKLLNSKRVLAYIPYNHLSVFVNIVY